MRRYSSHQSKNFQAKRRARGIITATLVVLSIALVVFVLSLLSSLGFLTITNVQISGVDQEKIEPIHTIVLEKLQGKYLGIFTRANTLIYPSRAIMTMIKKTYPEVQTVVLHRNGLHAITVLINEKTPTALVCATLPDFNGNELSLEDPGACYFADATGYIFKKAPSFSGRMYHRYYIPDLANDIDASSTDGVVGLYATSTSEFMAVQHFYDGLKQNNVVADAVLMKGGGEYEMYVRNPGTSSSTAVIYFTTASSSNEQLSNLISFWSHSLDTARAQKESLEFDYIDVRYGDNVFFRKSK